jgi:hypothetical protein
MFKESMFVHTTRSDRLCDGRIYVQISSYYTGIKSNPILIYRWLI